jgi:hypothetical protein
MEHAKAYHWKFGIHKFKLNSEKTFSLCQTILHDMSRISLKSLSIARDKYCGRA